MQDVRKAQERVKRVQQSSMTSSLLFGSVKHVGNYSDNYAG
jgi:hypothetical protein